MGPLVLQASPTSASSRLYDVFVNNQVTIEGSFSVVRASDKDRVAIWRGASPIGQPIEMVAISGTEGTFKIVKQGENFKEGKYVVGLVVDVNSNTPSICATVNFSNGNYDQTQLSTVIVTDTRNSAGKSYVTVSYYTPNGNTPFQNMDWIVLGEGNQPFDPAVNTRVVLPITTNMSADTVRLVVDPPLEYGKPYSVEYNPGSTRSAVSAFYTFQFAG